MSGNNRHNRRKANRSGRSRNFDSNAAPNPPAPTPTESKFHGAARHQAGGPSPGPDTYFSGAHHFGIETFNVGTSNVTNNFHSPGADTPMQILLNARAIEATHISKTAAYAPKCTPGTRISIIADILDWIKAGDQPIVWFSGPAGGGKTCIMRDVAYRCQQAGWTMCAYFFSTRVAGLDTADRFVATIVHQLLTATPVLRPMIFGAISRYPAIFQESFEFQLDKLLVEPLQSGHFQSGAPSKLPLKVVFVIDGFDECRDIAERQHLLLLLGSLQEKIPQKLVIVLASRPEFDIRTTFDRPEFQDITHTVLLQRYDGMADVRTYYCDEFEKIRQTHPRRRLIPANWPVEDILRLLIDKSSGNFILPSTIVKYISNPRRNPVEMLEKALASSSSLTEDNPLAALDALYSVILHPLETDFPLMKRILHCIIGMSACDDFARWTSPIFLDIFLCLPDGTVDATLCDLHSVLSIVSDYEGITFHHKSLEDYLLSPSRSLDLFQAPSETHIDLALACTIHLQQWAQNPGHIHANGATLYAARWWNDHLIKSLYGHDPASGAASIPNAILNFDSRIVARVWFVSAKSYAKEAIDALRVTYEVFHSAMCNSGSCFSLCRLLCRQHHCSPSIIDLHKSTANWADEARFALLPYFDIGTGLYDEAEDLEMDHPSGWRLLSLQLDKIPQTPTIRPLRQTLTEAGSSILIASIVARYVNTPHQNPADLLEKALSVIFPSGRSSPKPGSDAQDALYALALHPPGVDVSLIKRILHLLITLGFPSLSHPNSRSLEPASRLCSPMFLKDFLQPLPPDTVVDTLRNLHPVLYTPPNCYSPDSITFYCARSLSRYLLTPGRSKDLFQAPYETHIDLTVACTRIIQKWADGPFDSNVLDSSLRYALTTWDCHFAQCFNCDDPIAIIPPSILELDPRNFWRGIFAFLERSTGAGLHKSVWKRLSLELNREAVHATMCKPRSECLPFCKRLSRMRECHTKVDGFMISGTLLPRLEDRQRFDMETGLYDEDEVDRLSYPVGRRLSMAPRAGLAASTVQRRAKQKLRISSTILFVTRQVSPIVPRKGEESGAQRYVPETKSESQKIDERKAAGGMVDASTGTPPPAPDAPQQQPQQQECVLKLSGSYNFSVNLTSIFRFLPASIQRKWGQDVDMGGEVMVGWPPVAEVRRRSSSSSSEGRGRHGVGMLMDSGANTAEPPVELEEGAAVDEVWGVGQGNPTMSTTTTTMSAAGPTAASVSLPPPPPTGGQMGPWSFFASGYMLGLFLVAVLLHRIQNIIIPSRVASRRGRRSAGGRRGLSLFSGVWDSVFPLDLKKTTTRLIIHLPSLYFLSKWLVVWFVLVLQTSHLYPEDTGTVWVNTLGNWVDGKDMGEVCWKTFMAVCAGFTVEGFVKALDGVEAGFPIGSNMNPNTSPFNIVGYAFLLHLYASPLAHGYRRSSDVPSRPDKHAIITIAIPLLQLTMFHALSISKRLSTHRLLPTTLSSVLSLVHFHGALLSYFYGSDWYAFQSAPSVPPQTRLLTTYPILNYIPNIFETLLILTILLTVVLNVLVQLVVRGRVDRVFSGLGIGPHQSSSSSSSFYSFISQQHQHDDESDPHHISESTPHGPGGELWAFLQSLPYDEDFGVLLLRVGTASLEATGLRGWSNEVAPIPAPVAGASHRARSQRGRKALLGAEEQRRSEYGSVRVGRVGAGGVQSGYRVPHAAQAGSSSGANHDFSADTRSGSGEVRRRRRSVGREVPVAMRGLLNEVRDVDVGVPSGRSERRNGNRRSGWGGGIQRGVEVLLFFKALWDASKGFVYFLKAWVGHLVRSGFRGRGKRGLRPRAHRAGSASVRHDVDAGGEESEDMVVAEQEEDVYERFLRGENITDDEEEGEEFRERSDEEGSNSENENEDEAEVEDRDGDPEGAEAFGLFTDILRNGVTEGSRGGDVVLAHLVDKSPMTRRRWHSLSSRDHRRHTPDFDDWDEDDNDDPFNTSSSKSSAAIMDAGREIAARSVCVICTSEARDVICWPCRCLAMCDGCREALAARSAPAKHRCPCCRQPIEGYSKIYVP